MFLLPDPHPEERRVSKFKRVMLASLLAPLALPLLVVVFYSVIWLLPDTDEVGEIMRYSAFILVVLGYGYMFLLYLPVFLLMRLRGWTGPWHQSLSGFVPAIVIPVLWIGWRSELGVSMPMLSVFLFYGVLGTLPGWIFWWLGVRENKPQER